MRPETLRNKLNIAIGHWLVTEDSVKIKALIKPMKKRWYLWAKKRVILDLALKPMDIMTKEA